MFVVIFFVKCLDWDLVDVDLIQFDLQDEVVKFVKIVCNLILGNLQKLMDFSFDLVCFNCDCFKIFEVEFVWDLICFVVYVFVGDIYIGFEVKMFDEDEIKWVQDYLWILLGFYGFLCFLDVI